jgi:uncharacterized protein (DUF305 family)
VKTHLAPAAAAVTLAAGLLIGACSSSTDHGSMNMPTTSMSVGSPAVSIPAGAEFNATDVGFAQGMIPHHAQAIVMADMALKQSTNPEITKLAAQIKAAQAPEIDQLTKWLQAWGQPVPATAGSMDQSMGAMDGMDGMMMSGMMSDADMARLENTTGTDFDAMWLEMMTQHHQGAISMARDEVTGGKYAATKAMAESIVTSQQAEIDTMTKLMTQPQ